MARVKGRGLRCQAPTHDSLTGLVVRPADASSRRTYHTLQTHLAIQHALDFLRLKFIRDGQWHNVLRQGRTLDLSAVPEPLSPPRSLTSFHIFVTARLEGQPSNPEWYGPV